MQDAAVRGQTFVALSQFITRQFVSDVICVSHSRGKSLSQYFSSISSQKNILCIMLYVGQDVIVSVSILL